MTWSSNNTAVATVSGAGVATGLAVGTTTIGAAWEAFSGSAVLNVTPPPVSLPRGLWTWMGGSDTVPENGGQPGVYNPPGGGSGSDAPGSRQGGVTWKDTEGNLWLFGGAGYDRAGVNGYLNDVWEYAVAHRQWIWLGGGSTVPGTSQGQPGVYGAPGKPSSTNIPGGREGSAGWTDKAGNLWLFGGRGFDSAASSGPLNDLWELDPATGLWSWMGGSASQGQAGVYGRLGVGADLNVPGGRWGASSWTDAWGRFWLFGEWATTRQAGWGG